MSASEGEGSRSRKRGRPAFYSSEFMVAALLAPPMSVLALLLIAGIRALTGLGPAVPWDVILPFLFLLVLVLLCGAIPSLLFGGAVLSAIRMLGLPFSYPVLIVGGGVAAGLYIAAGLALASAWPSAAMMIAPWAILYQIDSARGQLALAQPDDLMVLGCILLSGVAAGLIYARSVLRG